ncbi:MAG: hypothetical protein AAB853_03960, partial [Patescibacteria group bacterium]
MNPTPDNTVQRGKQCIAALALAARPRLKNLAQTSWAFARKRPLLAGSSVMLVSLLLILIVAVAANDPLPPALAESGSVGRESAEAGDNSALFTTVSPALVNGASTVVLLGTVISNETANIYPRRDGIVEDIYMDIGDSVKKGQVVALLLPKGVEGESAAAIARKKAEKSKVEAEYETTQKVAQQSLNKTRQEIDEKREALAVALREQEGMIQRLALAAVNVEQMRDQAFVTLRSARQTIERLLLGSNSRTDIRLQEQHILPELGIIRRQTRYDIIPLFNVMKNLEDAYAGAGGEEKETLMSSLFAASQEVFPTMHALIASTGLTPIPLHGRGVSVDPADMTEEIHDVQTTVLEAK